MKAQRYRLLILGSVDASWSGYFGGMTVIADPTGLTRLVGEVADQSALHGLLNRIRDLNLRLVSVQLLDDDGDMLTECCNCPLRSPAR